MKTCRIVLIEDHDLTRVTMRLSVQQRTPITVVGEADNAQVGLQLVTNLQPDVAVVDIGLPDMDGIEVTRLIKARAIETKVLILTLRDREEVVLAAFGAGADSYCMKDISSASLREAIQMTASGYSWIDPAIAGIVLKQTRSGSFSFPQTEVVPLPAPESYALTERELEVLALIVEGCSNADIGEQLYITVGTVKTHVRNILNKLCADDRTQAAVRALRAGLVR
ncbi:response regulator [Synechococcales cyanobacterium C]|uniref:Response regulator n=1 Tax=Petrachloros mirabilis ULC683 TaxID=2781853 RepID=A0A8K1ZW39_9CYAN|nr:response regulator transcription factor [Petrachloros mirabilis]NCJ05958.1 response regulator [Petrachloros mirabilis ULC683]